MYTQHNLQFYFSSLATSEGGPPSFLKWQFDFQMFNEQRRNSETKSKKFTKFINKDKRGFLNCRLLAAAEKHSPPNF
jgi:hypothetical protein